MADQPPLIIHRCFADLDDPRREHFQQHRLLDIVIIAIAGTISRLLQRHQWRKVAPRPRHPRSDPEGQHAFKRVS